MTGVQTCALPIFTNHNSSTSIKYLFKYINKGYDRVTAVMVYDGNDAVQNPSIQNDELKEYVDCR